MMEIIDLDEQALEGRVLVYADNPNCRHETHGDLPRGKYPAVYMALTEEELRDYDNFRRRHNGEATPTELIFSDKSKERLREEVHKLGIFLNGEPKGIKLIPDFYVSED